MRSPFSGMDPFLKLHWLDVHGALIAETRRTLNATLPPGLVARMEERIAVESDEGAELRAGVPGTPATAYIYPSHLHDALPPIQIPLRPQDPNLMLPLQPMIEAIYTDGRYHNTLHCTHPLDPPLEAEDQQFAQERINACK